MKTRNWIILFLGIAAACAVALLVRTEKSSAVRIYSDGKAVMTLSLDRDGEYRIDFGEEWNILRVENGKISVIAASCATQDCLHHSPADHGAPIVCLPNRMVIEFAETENFDAFLQ